MRTFVVGLICCGLVGCTEGPVFTNVGGNVGVARSSIRTPSERLQEDLERYMASRGGNGNVEMEIAKVQNGRQVSRQVAVALMCQEGSRARPGFLEDLRKAEGQQLRDDLEKFASAQSADDSLD